MVSFPENSNTWFSNTSNFPAEFKESVLDCMYLFSSEMSSQGWGQILKKKTATCAVTRQISLHLHPT